MLMSGNLTKIKFGEVIEDFKDELKYVGHHEFTNNSLPEDLLINNDLDQNGIIWYRKIYKYQVFFYCHYCDLSAAYYLGVYLGINEIKSAIKILKTTHIRNFKGIINIIIDYLKAPKYYYFFTWNEFCGDREKFRCEDDFVPVIHYSENLEYMSKSIGVCLPLKYEKLDEKHKKQWCADLKQTSARCLKDFLIEI